MPPLRNISTVKPIKTERTHEENQERAYIAASRRSDRSLEARVESARRASEIHKRRTGRSLRVTEQDVINEEMYEEEDDDLPLQYRRLTANLQTGSLDFNRKLAAYLTHNVAVRSALNQAINDSFAQQYPGAQHFAHNQNPIFPSPLSTGAPPAAYTQSPQNTPTSPHPYRAAPYPMPGTPGFKGPQPVHKRANSSAVPMQSMSSTHNYNANTVDASAPGNIRRMSMPAATATKPDIKTKDGTASVTSSPGKTSKQEGKQKSSQSMGPPQVPEQQQPFFDFQQNMNPLTMTLPPDTQQLIGASLPPNDPFSSMLLGGNQPNQFFGFNDFVPNNYFAGQDGINATLAPNAYSNISTGSGMGSSSNNNARNDSFFDFKGVQPFNPNSNSAVNTPGESSFDAWINNDWTGDTT